MEPVSSADPGGISSSSARVAREEDLLALTISMADTETTTIKINPMAHDGMSPSVDSLALLTCNFKYALVETSICPVPFAKTSNSTIPYSAFPPGFATTSIEIDSPGSIVPADDGSTSNLQFSSPSTSTETSV